MTITKNMRLKTITEFFDDPFKQQAQNANFSKLANIMGFKPTANKVLNTVMLKNLNTWQKVEVVSSITALETLYMGGSSNIDGVIINICSDYIGANNLPLLERKGDFGSRLNNEAAASRYIFTRASKNFDELFNKVDLNILPRYNFENKDIEFQFLTFNLPMLLINGSEGMGSGHAQKILPRDPVKIKKCIINKLNGENIPSSWLKPYYDGFKGTIEQGENSKQWIFKGVFKKINSTKLEITEVPIGESYKSFIKKLDILVDKGIIKRYDDLCDPKADTFYFVVYHTYEFGKTVKHEDLKLVSKITENYTVIDENNSVKVHESTKDIIDHYFDIKMFYLQKRKDFLIEDITKAISIDYSKFIFIKNIVENNLIINKRKKTDIIKDIENIKDIITKDGNFDYLLNMTISSLSKERMESLEKTIKEKKKDLSSIKTTTIENMWLNEI